MLNLRPHCFHVHQRLTHKYIYGDLLFEPNIQQIFALLYAYDIIKTLQVQMLRYNVDITTFT